MENKRARISVSVQHGWRQTSATTAELVGGRVELDGSRMNFEDAVRGAVQKITASMDAALGVCKDGSFDEDGTRKLPEVQPFVRNDPRPDYKRSVFVYVSTIVKRPSADWAFRTCAVTHLRDDGTWKPLEDADIERLSKTRTTLYWEPSVTAYKEDDNDDGEEEEEVVSLCDDAPRYVITLEPGYVFE